MTNADTGVADSSAASLVRPRMALIDGHFDLEASRMKAGPRHMGVGVVGWGGERTYNMDAYGACLSPFCHDPSAERPPTGIRLAPQTLPLPVTPKSPTCIKSFSILALPTIPLIFLINVPSFVIMVNSIHALCVRFRTNS